MKTRVRLAATLLLVLASSCASRPPATDGLTDPPTAPDSGISKAWPSDTERPLDFAAALRRALEVSPTLRVLESARATARLSRRALLDPRNPEIRLAREEGQGSFTDTPRLLPGGPIELYDPLDAPLPRRTTARNEQNNIAVRLFPPNPFTLRPERRQARSLAEAAELRVEQERILIADRVRTAWLSLQYLGADARLAREHAALLDQAAALLAELAAEGSALMADVTDAEQSSLRALMAYQDADESYHAALADLSALLYHDPSSLRVGSEPWPSVPPPNPATIDTERAVRLAMDNAPDAALFELESTAAREAYIAARRAWIPWLSHVEVEYSEREGNREGLSGFEASRRQSLEDSWGVSLAFELPVFSLFHARPALLRSEWQALEMRAALGREARRMEALRAVAQVRRDAERLRAFGEKAEPAEQRLRQLVENLAAPGAKPTLGEVLASSQRLQIDRQRLLLDYRLRRNLLQLETLLGTDLQHHAPMP